MDISTNDERMITGAADGSVYVWPFPFINDPEKNITLGDEIKKTPKFTSYLSGGIIIVIRDDGEINLFDSVTHCLNASFSIPNFSSYLVIQVSPDRKRVSFASKDGFISIYEMINEHELKLQINEKIMNSKIFSMQWLNNESLLLCGSFGRLIIVNVKSDGENIFKYIISKIFTYYFRIITILENLINLEMSWNFFSYEKLGKVRELYKVWF